MTADTHTDTITRREPDGSRLRLCLNPSFDSLRDFLLNLPAAWDGGDGDTIFSKRNTVRLFDVNGTPLAVKRFARLTGFKRIIYSFFRASKGARAFDYSFRYNSADISTPRGVAYIEVSRHGLLSDVYLVTLRSCGSELFDALVRKEEFDTDLAAGAARFVLKMHLAGVMHLDPNLSNILYERLPGGSVRYEAIDINRSEFTSRGWSRSRQVHNLARLTHRRDLLLYLVKVYAAHSGDAPDALYRDVERAVRRIERNRALRHKIRDFFKK